MLYLGVLREKKIIYVCDENEDVLVEYHYNPCGFLRIKANKEYLGLVRDITCVLRWNNFLTDYEDLLKGLRMLGWEIR